MWMGKTGHVDGIRKFRTACLPMEQLVLSDKWARKNNPGFCCCPNSQIHVSLARSQKTDQFWEKCSTFIYSA